MTTPVTIVAYLALFSGVGALFVLANLLVGRLVRPHNPHPDKLEIYECGEPAIGSSFVQFDLRFYVVALLFIIFDVEVAFFFPWATVFGKATNVASAPVDEQGVSFVERVEPAADGASATAFLNRDGVALLAEMGLAADKGLEVSQSIADTNAGRLKADESIKRSARSLAWFSLADIGVFFGVLLVGFAYVWMRGDLNWVRALTAHTVETTRGSPAVGESPAAAMSA